MKKFLRQLSSDEFEELISSLKCDNLVVDNESPFKDLDEVDSLQPAEGSRSMSVISDVVENFRMIYDVTGDNNKILSDYFDRLDVAEKEQSKEEAASAQDPSKEPSAKLKELKETIEKLKKAINDFSSGGSSNGVGRRGGGRRGAGGRRPSRGSRSGGSGRRTPPRRSGRTSNPRSRSGRAGGRSGRRGIPSPVITGGAVAGGVVIGTSVSGGLNGLLDFISTGEGGYNSMNQGTRNGRIIGSTHDSRTVIGQNLTDMSVGLIMQRQSLPRGNRNRIFAAGKYQIIPDTMDFIIGRMGISRTSKFSPQLQERLGAGLIQYKRPIVWNYIMGRHNNEDLALLELAREWASLPDPATGNSVYGDGNRALHSVEEVRAALRAARASGGRMVLPQDSSGSQSLDVSAESEENPLLRRSMFFSSTSLPSAPRSTAPRTNPRQSTIYRQTIIQQPPRQSTAGRGFSDGLTRRRTQRSRPSPLRPGTAFSSRIQQFYNLSS